MVINQEKPLIVLVIKGQFLHLRVIYIFILGNSLEEFTFINGKGKYTYVIRK